MAKFTITVLGSGTSMGVPTLGCDCKVCNSADPRDNRLRPSVLLEFADQTVLIDTTPDFRQQALRERIRRIDAILYTHAHADHILGLDDLRPINLKQRGPIPIYGAAETLETIQRTFSYAFGSYTPESHVPKLTVNPLDPGGSVSLNGVEFQTIPLHHGTGRVFGYRFGNAAYLTDHSEIPAASMARLLDLDVLFLDALRHKPHPTHTTLSEAQRLVSELRPKRAYFTHISHDLPHAYTESTLPPHMRLAYDGLRIPVEESR